MRFLAGLLPLFYAASGCALDSDGAGEPPGLQRAAMAEKPYSTTSIATFDRPWAMTFLPGDDGRMLVTEKPGRLYLVWPDGDKRRVDGVPDVDHGGQGGLGDVIVHPGFATNRIVYLSYVEAGDDSRRGVAVARARLELKGGDARLRDVDVIWRQVPKTTGRGHYGHRLAFDADGYLFVSSGERQKFTPSQDMAQNLGKILRLNDDGSLPMDNPFADAGGVAAEVWSLGHRNPLGMAFDGQGRLWNHEMGPAGGDEFNLVLRGANYGYPVVSNGDHYNGRAIPDHPTRPEFEAPKAWWTPVISPGGLIFYDGDVFPTWRGDALIAALSGNALVRVSIDGESATETARYPMGARIREVEQGPSGHVWLLEDGKGGRLLKLVPTP